MKHTFNLADCPFKKVPEGVDGNEFQFELPVSKKNILFKILTGKEDKMLQSELKKTKIASGGVSRELTTRLRYSIMSIDGETNQMKINSFVNNSLLSKDSIALRGEIARVAPDIEMEQMIETEGGDVVSVRIPMTTEFFWPKAGE